MKFKKQKELYSNGTTMVALNNSGLSNIKMKSPEIQSDKLYSILCTSIKLATSLSDMRDSLIKTLIK